MAIQRYDQVLRVYNLSVQDLHTYFAGTSSVLVHNCGVGLPRPTVSDPTLEKNFVSQLYRPGATIGSGSTADAARAELEQGLTSGGHIEKADNYIKGLDSWLRENPYAKEGD